MKFPDFLSGPQIADGTLVVFQAKGAEVTVRLPIIPNYSDRQDMVTPEKDFTHFDVANWFETENSWFTRLVYQSWKYEDDITHDDIAHCTLKINLVALDASRAAATAQLHGDTFKREMVELLCRDYSEFCENDADIFSVQPITLVSLPNGKSLSGIKVQLPSLDTPPQPYPELCAYIPLNEQLSLSVYLVLRSLHYANRKNPYSEELLHQLKVDVFDEILEHLKINYVGETLDKITQLNS